MVLGASFVGLAGFAVVGLLFASQGPSDGDVARSAVGLPSHAELEGALRRLRREAPRWAAPRADVAHAALPAICHFLADKHLPLLVPLEQMASGGLWQATVSSGRDAAPLLELEVLEDETRPRSLIEEIGNHSIHLHARAKKRVLQVSEHGRNRDVLASIDCDLELRGRPARGDLAPFGRLERHGDGYLLKENSGREPRWMIAPTQDGAFHALWFPDGLPSLDAPPETEQQRLEVRRDVFGRHKLMVVGKKASEVRGGRLVGSAKPCGSQLEVSAVPGADAVLVMLCAVGAAHLDPSLGHHGFGSKPGLFSPSPPTAGRPAEVTARVGHRALRPGMDVMVC